MGNCVYSEMINDENRENNIEDSVDQFSVQVKQQTNPSNSKQAANRYKSGLINPNIGKVPIVEEESFRGQSSFTSFQDEAEFKRSLVKSRTSRTSLGIISLLQDFQKQFPLGDSVDHGKKVKLMNLSSNRYLHSHAVKYEFGSKQYEVSGCIDGEHEYDFWTLITEGELMNQSIVIFHHCLTGHVMRSNQKYRNMKSQKQQVLCCDAINDVEEIDYWKLEIMSATNKLTINAIISNLDKEIKHVKSEGYLNMGRHKGIYQNHLEIIVDSRTDLQDLWVIQE